MRLALLHFTAAPTIGGVEQVMEAHARLLAADGHEVRTVAGAALEDLETALAGCEVVIAHNLLTMPFHLRATHALWELAARWPSVRFITWVHDVAAANPDYDVPHAGEAARLHAYCPHFEYAAVSELRRRELHRALDVPLERCRVIPNGLWPLEQWRIPAVWHPFIAEHRLLERALVLLHPARLVRRKNVEQSLLVTAALRAAGIDTALLVTAAQDVHQAAGTAYEAELRSLRESLQLTGHAFFLSDIAPLPAEDMPGFFRLADAILFPSRQEGFGLPMLEAALHGIPIFCPDIEPLNTLPAAPSSFYPPAATAEEIAVHMRRALGDSPLAHTRQQGLHRYFWPIIYRNFIAPLLAARKTDPIP